ncbi:MAG: hypothetical protein L3J56_01595 [Bacteroidales bacterium]|nr:hypothetical protein [Bacteroidales bacterium]
MQFEKGYLYHIYNQGNNKQKIFFNRDNYLFFLEKIHTHILLYVDVLAWCLMPNHFHFMVLVNKTETHPMTSSHRMSEKRTGERTLNNSIAIMLRSYTRAVNKEQNLSGSLFRQKTKAECINCPNGITPSFIFNPTTGSHRMNVAIPEKQYLQVCFNYIHQNPVEANLVKNAVDWEFSSAKDYAGLRKGKLINKKIAKQYVEI